MMKKWGKLELEDWINLILTILFWGSIVSFLLGLGKLGIILSSFFFFSLGLIILYIALLYISERKTRLKSTKLIQWLLLIGGLAVFSIGAWTLEISKTVFFAIGLPLSRIILKHSIRDITKDKAQAKHPWMDHLSDGFFILALLSLCLAFFSTPSQLMIGSMLIFLSISLNLDQLHKTINKNLDLSSIGIILTSTALFLVPGIILVFTGSLYIHS